MFVDDNLIVNIRNGQSEQHKILGKVYSGHKLEILETTKEYSHVRTAEGAQGWVLSRFLTTKSGSRHKLIEAQKIITQLQSQIENKDKEISGLNKTHNVLKQQFEKKEVDIQRLKAENTRIRSLAENPLKLSSANQQLKEQSQTLKTQFEKLQEEVADLQDYSEQQWFLKGAGVILSGMLIGVFIPKIRRQQKSGW
jgi:SH3 domain protein